MGERGRPDGRAVGRQLDREGRAGIILAVGPSRLLHVVERSSVRISTESSPGATIRKPAIAVAGFCFRPFGRSVLARTSLAPARASAAKHLPAAMHPREQSRRQARVRNRTADQ